MSDSFENEKVGILLLKMSLPVMLSMLVSELYNMIDTIFVGNYVDPSGVGALSVVFPIQRIIIALSMMIGIGTSTAFTRARGAQDYDSARNIITNGFTLVLAVMLPLTVFIYFNAESVLSFLGGNGAILSYGVEYLSFIIFGSIFLSWTIFTSNIMISLGKTKISIMSTAIGAIMNFFIDLVLVKYLHMGVKGAAVATLVSQIAGFLFAYYHLSKLKREMNVERGFKFSYKYVLAILAVGVSAFIVEAEDGILMAVLNNLLDTVAKDEGIIILAVITKVYMFLFVTLFGISSGMQPIAAYNLGAKNYVRLKEVLRKTIIWATLVTGIMWAFSMIFSRQIIRVFIADELIIQKAIPAFRMMVAVFPLISVYYIAIFYFQALGIAKKSIFLSVLRQIVIMIPLSIFLVITLNMGADGVWLSYPIADGMVFVIGTFMLYKEFKRLDTLV
mgnify:FL=1